MRVISRNFLLLVIVLTLCLEVGCVRRRMCIRAFPDGNPHLPITGATVYVNKHPVGQTPVSCHFTHYGTMEFTVIKEGYEPLTEYRKIRAPWYQWPGIDFFSEVVWPQKITDTKQIDFQLRPEQNLTQDELIDRAESMRRESQTLATFRTESGTTTGIINPVTTLPVGGEMSGAAVIAPSDPYQRPVIAPSGVGSVGPPISPFTNTPVMQNPTDNF